MDKIIKERSSKSNSIYDNFIIENKESFIKFKYNTSTVPKELIIYSQDDNYDQVFVLLNEEGIRDLINYLKRVESSI